ncbi:MAG: D-tyrosyl-tRNA(Tyr) deacylase [Candidatus Methylomirabilis sp.]|nr:D-tyrosyl-tRNA(Tyr) deacylase [Deltaproteobacteria bacterium]
MRAVVQRVRRAEVRVDGETVGRVEAGLLILLGVRAADTEADADYLAQKIAGLRILEDAEGKMNLSVREAGGGALVVSQFTLYGDVHRGLRPSFSEAAPPELARDLYEYFVRKMKEAGIPTQEGVFQAMMEVELVNWGPVTILLDSEKAF